MVALLHGSTPATFHCTIFKARYLGSSWLNNLGIEGSGKPDSHSRLWSVLPRGGCLQACNPAGRSAADNRPPA